jgi:HEAT repeat protein
MIHAVLLLSMMAAMNAPPDAAPQIRQLLHKDITTRWCAAYALGKMGDSAGSAVEPLVAVLNNLDENEYVRGMAAWALGRIGSGSASALPPLQKSLASTLPSLQRNAAQALGELGPAARPAVDPLLKLLDTPDAVVRARAAEALWRIDRHPRALAAFVTMLQGDDVLAAYEAASALGELDRMDAAVIAPLVAALGHKDQDVSRVAARTLGSAFGTRAIPSLRKVIDGPDEQLALRAVDAMDWMGPAATDSLIESLKHPSPRVRREAARSLGRQGPKARKAIPALVRSLDDAIPLVRDELARALDHIREKE